jgi:Domain of unknown function (DUF4440)
MRKYQLLFLIASILLFACNIKQTTSLTEDEAIDVIRKFDDGWRNKNMKEVDSALSPMYVYFTQSGGMFSRDSVVATAGESTYELHDMSRSEFNVEIIANTAVVSTRWKGKGSYRGNPFDEDQRCSIVVVKKGDIVQIFSEHCTPIKGNKIFH